MFAAAKAGQIGVVILCFEVLVDSMKTVFDSFGNTVAHACARMGLFQLFQWCDIPKDVYNWTVRDSLPVVRIR